MEKIKDRPPYKVNGEGECICAANTGGEAYINLTVLFYKTIER